MNKKKKRRKLKKSAVTITALSIIIILCIIVQVFFMPKWENGNTNTNKPSSNGVHTQEGSDFTDSDKARKIHIKN